MDRKLLLLLLLLATSCTKKVWQCTTRFDGCPSYLMHTEDYDKTGTDSFWDAHQGKYIYEHINCK